MQDESEKVSGGVGTGVAVSIIVAVLVLVGVLLYWYYVSSQVQVVVTPDVATNVTAPATVQDYTFYPGKDSGGNDIRREAALAGKVAELKLKCDELANCVGFNTNGWLKHTLGPMTTWTKDPNKGFYVKPGVPV